MVLIKYLIHFVDSMEKIKHIIIKHKLLFLFVFISIVSLFYLVVSTKKQTPIPFLSPSPAPSLIPLDLIRTEPLQGKQKTIWTTTAVSFVFNQEIDIKTLSYTIFPSTKSAPFLGPQKNILYIRPQIGWKESTPYQIKIVSLSSVSGQPLLEEKTYDFEIELPTNIISE